MPAGTGVTAWNALYGNLLLNPGQTVVFLGTGASFALRSSTLLAGTEDKSKTLLLSFSKACLLLRYGPKDLTTVNESRTSTSALGIQQMLTGEIA
ncbi:hypothetical protein PI125_g22498 [Phytophthora idaei]|nr:hypothetical protein PI125_g22498 [Phytophthora idaei]